jgi:hypothetical protein
MKRRFMWRVVASREPLGNSQWNSLYYSKGQMPITATEWERVLVLSLNH